MRLVSPAGLRAQVRELWGPGMLGLGWRSGRGGRCQQGLQAAGATEGGERQQGPRWGPGDRGTWPATAPGCPRGCQWAQTSAGGSWLFHSVLVAFTQEGRGRGQAGGAAWSHVGGRPLPSAGPGPRGFISVPLCSHRRGSCQGRPAVCTWAGTAPLALRSRHRTHHPWSAAARQGAGAGHGPSTGHPSGCRCNEDWTAVLSPGTGLVAGPGLQQGLCPRRHAGAWVRACPPAPRKSFLLLSTFSAGFPAEGGSRGHWVQDGRAEHGRGGPCPRRPACRSLRQPHLALGRMAVL